MCIVRYFPQHLVEGLLNSCPRVSVLLAEFAVFGPPRATRTSLLLLLLLLLLMSPPPVFKLVNFNRKTWFWAQTSTVHKLDLKLTKFDVKIWFKQHFSRSFSWWWLEPLKIIICDCCYFVRYVCACFVIVCIFCYFLYKLI